MHFPIKLSGAMTVPLYRRARYCLPYVKILKSGASPAATAKPGESLATTAVREIKEEAGLDIELLRFVGVYTRLGLEASIHIAVFLAQPIGGESIVQQNLAQPDEVLDIRYLIPPRYPTTCFGGTGSLSAMRWPASAGPCLRPSLRRPALSSRGRSFMPCRNRGHEPHRVLSSLLRKRRQSAYL